VELGSKRVRESDEEEDLPKPAANGTHPDQKLSKKEKKRLKKLAEAAEEPPAKKVKGVDGQAVPVPAAEKKANSEKEQKKQKKEKKEKENGETNAQEPKESKVVKQPNGLIIKDSKVGPGATVKKGSKVELRYIGKLADGTTFDSNTSGTPVRISFLKFLPLCLINIE
jgi:FK506-binding nuclear protein